MKNAARAIIKINNDYIFMKREKNINGNKIIYYTTIGGHLEDNENFEECCIREVFEETGINVKILEIFYESYNIECDKYEKFYKVEYIDGILGTGKGEEFSAKDIQKYGKYEIIKINEYNLKLYNILPMEIKDKLINE